MLEPLCRSWLEPRRQPALRSSPAWASVLHGGGSPNASRVPSPRPRPSPDLQWRARTQGRHEGETWREDTASHADTLLQGRRIYPLALISLGCHTFLVLYAREGNPLKIPPQQGTGLPPWNINQTDGTWEEGPYCNLTTQTQRKSIMLRVREHAYILSSKSRI